MPYDPKTGKYTPEDAGVAKRVTDILSTDSPLMQQAATQGRQDANRRGLLNTTMAVTAAQAGRINAALPIASQEAGQVHQTNLQGTDIESRERMQGKDIGNTQLLQSRDITSRERMLGRELGSREQMQQRDIELQRYDINTRERISSLDREAQSRIANLNVAAGERQNASALAASFESSYSNTIANIMNNPEIPAADRQRYLDHAARVRDSNLSLVEQMYSIELNWQTAGTPRPRPSAQPGGPPPGSIRPGLIR